MKKKKLFLSLLLVLTLVLVLLPGLQTEADAAAAGRITVNGYDLPSGYYLPTATWTQTTTKPSGSYFYYSSGTLTVYNVTLSGTSGTRAVYAEGDLVVNLSGTNKLTTTNAYGIRATGTLKFTGSGSLTVTSSGYDAIYSSGNLEFAQTGTVTAAATGTSSSGVECGAKLTIGGNLTATAESSYAIFASGDISMAQGVVNATGNCTYSVGAIRSNGAMTVSGGTLNVTSKSDGIISKYDFTQKAGNVTVNADWNGIIVENSTNDARISEGTLTVTAVRDGIKARKFFMNGGHGYIKSSNTSSDSSYYAVKLAGNSSTYFSMKGNVKASGSTTTSSGGLTSLTYANLPTYDYVFFTGYISVNGVELRDGHYLQSGKTTTSTGMPSGGYAYYSGNTLTLNNYEGSNTGAHGVYHGYNLNIQLVSGTVNKLTTASTKGTTYDGVYAAGDLFIGGGGRLEVTGGKRTLYTSGNLSISLATIRSSSGLYASGNMDLNNAYIMTYQLGTHSVTHAIEAGGSVSITSGAIYIQSPDYVNGNYIHGIDGKGITISGSAAIEIKTIGIAIYSSGDLTISGGNVNVEAVKGTGIDADGTMRITGGTVKSNAYCDGLQANQLVVTGGQITASSNYTSTDSTYCAVKVYANNTTYFDVASNLVMLGSTASTASNVDKLSVGSLSTYDYIRIGDFVKLHDVELPSGSYLATGNSSNTPTTVKPSGGYAYYKDGVLTLSNYSYSGTAKAVKGDLPLTIQLSGDNQINHIEVHASTTFTGDGSLKVKQNSNSYGVYALGDLCFNNGQIDIDAPTNNGIYCHSLTIRDGKVTVTSGTMNGVILCYGKLTVTGGVLIAKSTATDNDTSFRAIASLLPSFNLELNGLNHMVNTESTPYDLPSTEFVTGDYDFVALGEFVMVRGVILSKGECLPNGKTTPTTTIPATGYAYCSNANYVILKDYSFSGRENGVVSNTDLTVVLDGANTLDAKTKSESSGNSYVVENCNAIMVRGNLTIGGRTYETDTLTAKSMDGMTIHCTGDLTIESDQITATSEGNAAIYVKGSMQMNNGSVTASAKCDEGSVKMPAIEVAGDVTVSGGILVATGSPNGGAGMIVKEGDFRNTGCTVITTGAYGNGLSVGKGNLSMQGGELHATGLYSGIALGSGRLNMSDGFMVATSTNTASDSSYCALNLAGSTSSYYNVAVSGEIASTSPIKDSPKKLDPTKLSTYDYVQLGDFVEINGITIKSGYSINGTGSLTYGNGGSGYAYYVSEYAGNTLTLNGFKSTVKDVTGILSTSDLTIKVIGSSSITSDGAGVVGYANIIAAGNVTFTGTQTLTLNSDIGSLDVTGNVVFSGGNVTMDQTLEATEDVIINSGIIHANGYHYAISAKNVKVNGGQLFAQSSEAGQAVYSTTFTYSSDLTAAGGFTGRYDQKSQFYNSQRHKEYRFLYVGDCVLVYGVILPTGRYMASGSTAPVLSTTSTNYVYYANGTLTMRDYTILADVHGVNALRPLTINVVGTNSLTTSGRVAAIRAESDLEITGTGSLTCSTTVDLGLSVPNGDLTIENATVTLTSSHYGTIEVSNGDLIVNSGSLNCSSDKYTNDVVNAGNMTVNGGTVTVTSKEGTGIECYDGTVTINGGTVDVTGYLYGVFCADFVMTDGSFKAISPNRDNDYLYMAVYGKMDISKISSHIKLANTTHYESGAKPYVQSEHSSYDYICFEPMTVKVKGIEIPDGDYLLPSGTKAITILPTGTTAYAQRVGNRLNLVNFSYTTGGMSAVEANSDIELVLIGTNSFNTGTNAGIKVAGKLTISGAGSLSLTSDSTTISAVTGVTIGTAKLTLTSNNSNTIYVSDGDLTVNSGDLTVSAKYNGIIANKVTFNGGTALIKSMITGTDDPSFSSISTDGLTVGSGLVAYGSTEYNGATALQIDPVKLTTYDYIKVAAGTPTPPASNITVKCIGKAVTYTVSGNVVTVTHDKPCKVGYLGSDGKYVTLKGTKKSDGSYTFTAPAGVTEVLLGVKGDITGDGKINVIDVSKLYAHVKQTSFLSGDILFIADITGDGRINVIDVSKLYAHVKQTAPLTWDT